MPNVTAGSILIAQSTGSWVNEQNWELTGTVGVGDVPAPYQIYLGASASSTPDYYVGYFITTSLFNTLAQYYNCQVTAYNSTTKVATVGWQAADASPPVGTQWRCFIAFPVQSSYQWQRDGVDISGQTNRSYTATASDIGKTISFYTTGGSVPQGTSPTTKAKPTVTSTNAGSPTYTVTGPTPSGNFVNSSEDFTLLGAIRLAEQYTGMSLTVVPASRSPSGQKCLYASGAIPYPNYGVYLTIPTLTQSYNTSSSMGTVWNTFPSGSICQKISEGTNIFGGKYGVGVAGGAAVQYGAHVIDSTYMLVSCTNSYTFDPNTCVIARRSTNLSSSSPVDLFVLYDPLAENLRWRSGSISEIPTQYRSALGGDLMVAGGPLSIHSNLSQGPASFVFNSSDIDPALAKATSGTSISGTTTTMVLDTNANTTTTDYYKNSYLVVGTNITVRITGYNASTRTATVASAVLPTTSTAYQIIPSVIGKQLVGYNQSQFFASDAYGAIWDTAGSTSTAVSSVIINNTKSLLCSTNGAFGVWDYGISIDARPNGVGGGARLYAPYTLSNGNADQMSHYFFKTGTGGASAQIVVYNTDDVATVASGAATYYSLTPKAVFSLPVPYDTNEGFISIQFDNTDGKLYAVCDLEGEFAYPIILVYQCNKWS